MYDLCRHLLASGRRCTQPAVSGTSYCRHHRVVKRTIADSVLPSKLHGLHKAIPFLYPEDRAAIQANCFLVLRALDDRRINTQTANAMGRLLRTCELNLKRGPLHESDAESTLAPRDPSSDRGPLKPASGLNAEHIVRRVVLTPSGEEIAPPREVWEEGEDERHGEECSCRRCKPAPEQHHPDCQCGECPPNSDARAPLQEKPDNSAPAQEAGAEATDKDKEERESERRRQIIEKHKHRFTELENEYQYSPELADRTRDLIQEIMELEMGPENFSYQLPPSASERTPSLPPQ